MLLVTDSLKYRESTSDPFQKLSLSANFDAPVAVENGGTGADNAADARVNLGITVYHKLVLGTTSAAGNLVLGLNSTDHILIAAATNRKTSGYRTAFYNIMPCGADTDGNLFVTAFQPGTSQTTSLASTAIAVDVWYILNNSVNVTA